MRKDIHTTTAATRVKYVGASAKEALQALLQNLDDLLAELNRQQSAQDEMSAKGYLNTTSAAEYLDIPIGTLRQHISKNAIRHYKPTGGSVYFKRADLDEFMMRGVIPSNNDILSGRA